MLNRTNASLHNAIAWAQPKKNPFQPQHANTWQKTQNKPVSAAACKQLAKNPKKTRFCDRETRYKKTQNNTDRVPKITTPRTPQPMKRNNDNFGLFGSGVVIFA